MVEGQARCSSVSYWGSNINSVLVCLENDSGGDRVSVDGQVHWIFYRFDYIPYLNVVSTRRVNVYRKDYNLLKLGCVNYSNSIGVVNYTMLFLLSIL